MYIPPHFREADVEKLHDFVEQHGFATLVSSEAGAPSASHLPLLLEREHGPRGRLLGHMARANPQWQSAAGARVLAIFHGPHAYVSPAWMEARNVVPTWNYVTVHASGSLRTIEDRDRLREILQRTVHRYESDREQPWSMAAPDGDFLEKMLAGIVGFEIEIDQLEGKWKLSQNHPAERRAQVVRGLRETGGHDEQQVAVCMESTRIDGGER